VVPTQLPSQWMQRTISQGLKRPRPEADHSLHPVVGLRINEFSLPSPPPHIFVECTGRSLILFTSVYTTTNRMWKNSSFNNNIGINQKYEFRRFPPSVREEMVELFKIQRTRCCHFRSCKFKDRKVQVPVVKC
jgi:hypothetical protein